MSGLGNRRRPRRAATLPPEPPPAKLARAEGKQRVQPEEKEKEFKEPKLPKPKKERKDKEPREKEAVRDIRHTGPPRCSFCLEKLGIKSHIKCLECEDTLICLKCYALGTEGNKHKRGHDYQIPGSQGSLFARSWTYPEEQDLITTAQRFKLGNWDEVAATLSKAHGRQRLCEETSRHFQLYFVQSTLGRAAMKAREWIERRSDFITDINDLLNDPSGRELGYHAVIEALRALDDADLPDVNEKDLAEKLWQMTEKHFGTLSRLQKKRKASALSYRAYRSQKKAPFPYGEDDDEEWWIRDGRKKKPNKPVVNDESDGLDNDPADEKDDDSFSEGELEEFIEEGGMEKILEMFQKAKLNEDPAVQECLSEHAEERPLPGQPQMKRVKWSGMKTRSDCSDDDSFFEKPHRDPSEIDLPDARSIPYSDGRRNVDILMDIGVDGDLKGCKSGVIGRIHSIVEMEKEATPIDPDQPVMHEIKREIKEEEPDEVVDDPMENVDVNLDVEDEQSEDEVDSAKTESDTDVSVVSEQVFDDENYEANMRAKGYGTDEMYSDWDDASKNEAVSRLKSLSKRGVLSDSSEVEDDQEEEIERSSSDEDDVAPRRTRPRARVKRTTIESSDEDEEGSSGGSSDDDRVITALQPKQIPYHEIESEREQLDVLFGKKSEQPKTNKVFVKKTKTSVVKLFKLGSDGRYHIDTEEIDEPIDDFLLDSVEEVGSKEWIVRRLSTLKQFYYDKDPESGRWHAKYPIPSVDSELDAEIDEYGKALFAYMEEERRVNAPPQDPEDVDMDRTPEARFGDDPDVKPTQEELQKLTVAVDAQEPLTLDGPEFGKYLMEHFLEDLENSDEESVSSEQICDLISATSRLGHSPSPEGDESEYGEDEDDEENESDEDARRTPDSALGDDEDEGEEDEEEGDEGEDEASHIKEEPMDADPQEAEVKQEIKEENPDDGCHEDAPAPAAAETTDATAAAAAPVKEEPTTPEHTAPEPAPLQIKAAEEIKKEIKQEVKEEPQDDGYPTGAVLASIKAATPHKTPTPIKAPILKSPSSIPVSVTVAKPAVAEKEIKTEVKEEPEEPKEPEDPEDDFESDEEEERPVTSPIPHALLLHTAGRRRAYTIIPLQPAVITPREDYTKSRSTPPPCQPSSTPSLVLNVKEELPEEHEAGADRVPARDRGHTPGRADLLARGLKVLPVGPTPVLLDPNDDASTSNTPEPFLGSTEVSPEPIPAAKEIKEEPLESDGERTPPAVQEKTPEPVAPVAPVAAAADVKEEPMDDNDERVSTPGHSMGSPATPVGPNDLALEDFMDEPEGHTDETEDDEATIDTAENSEAENPDDFNDDDLHGSFCNCRNCKYDRHEPLSDEEVGSDEERLMREQEEMGGEEEADEYGEDEQMNDEDEEEMEDEMEDEMDEDEEGEEFDESEIKNEEPDDEEDHFVDPPSPADSNHIPIPEDEIKQEEDEEQEECSKEHDDGLCGCEMCGNVRASAVDEDSETEHDLARKINKSGVVADVAAELQKNYVDDSDLSSQSDGYDASSESNDDHSEVGESDYDDDETNEFHATPLMVSTEDVDDYLTSHPSLSPSAFMTMKEAKEFVNKCNSDAKAIKEEPTDDHEEMSNEIDDVMRSPSSSPEPERNNYVNEDESIFHRDGEDYPICHPCLSPSAVIQPREADKLVKKCNAEAKKKEKEKKRQEKKEKQEEEERAIIQSMRRKGLRPDEKLDDEKEEEEKEEEKEEEEDKDKTPPMLHGDPLEDEPESSQNPPELPRTPLLVIKKVQKRGRTDLRVETRPRTAKEEQKMEDERKRKEEEEKRMEKEEQERNEETDKKKKKKTKKEKHVEFREEKEEKKEEELISPPKKKIPRELQGLIMDNELRQYELTQSKSLKERASKAIGTQKEKFTRCGTTVHVSDSEPEIDQRIRKSEKKSKGDATVRSKKIIESPVVEDLPRSSRRIQQPTDPKRKPSTSPGKKGKYASKKGAKKDDVKENWCRGRKRPAEPYPVDESSDEEIPETPTKKGPQPKRRRKNKRVSMSKKERKAQWDRKVQNRKAREAEKAEEKKRAYAVAPSQKVRRRRQMSQERLDAYRFLFRRLPYDYEDYGFRNRVNFKGWINDIYNMGYSQERDDFEVDFFNEGEQIVSRVNIVNIGYRDLPHQIEAEVKIARAQRYFRVCQERRALRNYAAEYERVLAFLNLSMKMCAMTEKRKPKLRDIFRSRTAEEKFDGKLAQVLARDELLEMKQARTRLLKIRSRTDKLQQLHIAGKTTLDDLNRCYRYRRVCSEVVSRIVPLFTSSAVSTDPHAYVVKESGDVKTIPDADRSVAQVPSDLSSHSEAIEESQCARSMLDCIALGAYSAASFSSQPSRASSPSAKERVHAVIDAVVAEYGHHAVEAFLDGILVLLHDKIDKETVQRPNDLPEEHKYGTFRPCSMEALEVPIFVAPQLDIAVGGGGVARQRSLVPLFTSIRTAGASSLIAQIAPVRSAMGGAGGSGGARPPAVGPPPVYSSASFVVSSSQSAGSSANTSESPSSSQLSRGKFAVSSNRSCSAKYPREQAPLVPKIKDKKKKKTKEDQEMNEVRIGPHKIKPFLGSTPTMVVEIDLRPDKNAALATDRQLSNHPSLTPSRECSRLPSPCLLPTPIVYKDNGHPANRRILNGGHPWQRPDKNHHYRKRFPGPLRMLVLQMPRRPPCPDLPWYPDEPVMRGRFLNYSIVHQASKYAEMRKWADFSLANHRTYLRCLEEKKYDVLAQMGPFMPYFPYLPEYWISPAHVARYLAGEKLQDRFRTIFHASADQHRGLYHPAGFRIEEGMLQTTARDWLREAISFAHDTRCWHAAMPHVEDRDALLQHLALLREADKSAPRPALDADYNKMCGAYLPLPFRYVRFSPAVDKFDPADPYGAVDLPHEWTRERPPRRCDFHFSMADPFRRSGNTVIENSVWRELGQFAVSMGKDAIKCVCGAEEVIEEESEEEVLKGMIAMPLKAEQEKARAEWQATFHAWPNEEVPLTEVLTKEQIERGVQLRALRYPQSTKGPTAPPLEQKKKVPVCFENSSFDQSTSSAKDDDDDDQGDGGGHFFDGEMMLRPSAPPLAHEEQEERTSTVNENRLDDLVDRMSLCVIEPLREVLVEEEFRLCSRHERCEDDEKEPLRRTEQGPVQKDSKLPNEAITRVVKDLKSGRKARLAVSRNVLSNPRRNHSRSSPRPSSSTQQMPARNRIKGVAAEAQKGMPQLVEENVDDNELMMTILLIKERERGKREEPEKRREMEASMDIDAPSQPDVQSSPVDFSWMEERWTKLMDDVKRTTARELRDSENALDAILAENKQLLEHCDPQEKARVSENCRKRRIEMDNRRQAASEATRTQPLLMMEYLEWEQEMEKLRLEKGGAEGRPLDREPRLDLMKTAWFLTRPTLDATRKEWNDWRWIVKWVWEWWMNKRWMPCIAQVYADNHQAVQEWEKEWDMLRNEIERLKESNNQWKYVDIEDVDDHFELIVQLEESEKLKEHMMIMKRKEIDITEESFEVQEHVRECLRRGKACEVKGRNVRGIWAIERRNRELAYLDYELRLLLKRWETSEERIPMQMEASDNQKIARLNPIRDEWIANNPDSRQLVVNWLMDRKKELKGGRDRMEPEGQEQVQLERPYEHREELLLRGVCAIVRRSVDEMELTLTEALKEMAKMETEKASETAMRRKNVEARKKNAEMKAELYRKIVKMCKEEIAYMTYEKHQEERRVRNGLLLPTESTWDWIARLDTLRKEWRTSGPLPEVAVVCPPGYKARESELHQRANLLYMRWTTAHVRAEERLRLERLQNPSEHGVERRRRRSLAFQHTVWREIQLPTLFYVAFEREIELELCRTGNRPAETELQRQQRLDSMQKKWFRTHMDVIESGTTSHWSAANSEERADFEKVERYFGEILQRLEEEDERSADQEGKRESSHVVDQLVPHEQLTRTQTVHRRQRTVHQQRLAEAQADLQTARGLSDTLANRTTDLSECVFGMHLSQPTLSPPGPTAPPDPTQPTTSLARSSGQRTVEQEREQERAKEEARAAEEKRKAILD